jgi:hypothetical protein
MNVNEILMRIINDKTIEGDERAWSECKLSTDKYKKQ